MPSLSECTILVAKEFEGLDPADLDVFTKELEAKRQGLSPGAFKDIIEAMASAQTIDMQRLKHQQLNNVRAKIALTQFILKSFPDNPALGLEAAMVGVQRARTGALSSAAAGQRALSNKNLTSFAYDLERTGFSKEFISGELDRDFAVAIHRMGQQEETGAIDLNIIAKGLSPKAVEVAKVVRKWNDVALNDANLAGAMIKRDPNYIMRQNHNPLSLRRAARILTNGVGENSKAWKEFILPLLDTEKTFDGIDDIEDFLQSTYEALASGVHLAHAGSDMSPNVMKRLQSISKRMSQSRLLHFKDGDAFYRYNKKMGTDRFIEGIYLGLESNANNVALMRKFGPNARNNYESVFELLMKRTKGEKSKRKLKGAKAQLDRFFDTLDGSDRVPENVIRAKYASNIRAIQSFSKLGGATISAITDIEFMASTLRAQDVPWHISYARSFEALFKGKSSEEKKQLISMIGVANDSMRGGIMSRLSAHDSMPGDMSKGLALYFRLNLLTPWTDNARAGFAQVLVNNVGLHSGKTFDDLPTGLAREFDKFGISSDDWDVIRKAQFTDEEGKVFVVPEEIRNSSDVDIDKLIKPEVAAIQTAAANKLGEIAKKQGTIQARIAGRVKKFKAMKAKKAERRAKLEKRLSEKVDAHTTELRLKASKLKTQEEIAQIDSDIAVMISEEKSEAKILDILDAVEEGEFSIIPRKEGAPHPEPQTKTTKAIQRLGVSQRKIAEALGRKRGRVGKQLEDINRKIVNSKSKAKGQLTRQQKADTEFLDAELSEMAEFTVELESEFAKTRIASDEAVKLVDVRIEAARGAKREQLEAKYREYISESVDDGVMTPGIRTQSTLRFGQRPGSTLGIAISFITQFKAFPVGLYQRLVKRELFGKTADGIEFLGLTQMMAGSVLFGYTALALKDLSRGRSIRKPETVKEMWDLTRASLLQGGGLGIYGDFLFGEMRSRYGQTPIATMLGPTAGVVDDIFDMYGKVLDGESAGSDAFNTLINNTPAINLFYTRMITDYFILHNLREMANPGYLKRLEKRIEKDQAQSYIIAPSRVIPKGGTLNPIEIGGNIAAEVPDVELGDLVGR